MNYAAMLSILGACVVALGILQGGWALLSIWLGANFVMLGLAHHYDWVRVFGKRSDGSLAWWSWVLFLPLQLLTHGVWHLRRLVDWNSKFDEVTPDLVLGRRLLSFESRSLLTTSIVNYVDLTSEFQEPRSIRQNPAYVSVPMLDGSELDCDTLAAAIEKLRPGRTYIHCAQGRGRTAVFAIALVLARGEATTVKEALAMLRVARPKVRLNCSQRACVNEFANRLSRCQTTQIQA